MPLRANLLHQFHQRIDDHLSRRFQVLDFEIGDSPRTLGWDSPWESFEVRYRYENYSFKFDIPKGSTLKIDIKLSPGSALDDEQVQVETVSGLLNAFSIWLDRINEELHALPLAREVARQRAQLDELVEKMGHVEESMFTREEAARVNETVQTIDAKLVGVIEQMGSDRESLAAVTSQVEALRRELDQLRGEIQTTTKKMWFTKLFSRLFRIAQDPAVQKIALEAAERGLDRVLPPHQ